MKPSDEIQVVKRDHLGREVFRYPGRVLAVEEEFIQLEAAFTYESVEVEEITLLSGDCFVETFYFDRWYNIFEIHKSNSNEIKAYYCNIGFPAVLADGEVSYRDLALDLLVRPDGRETLLDLDEFETLTLDTATRQQALNGLAQLRAEMAARLT